MLERRWSDDRYGSVIMRVVCLPCFLWGNVSYHRPSGKNRPGPIEREPHTNRGHGIFQSGSMNIAWVSDPHLDHCDEPRRRRFLDELAAARPGVVVVSGDIAEQPTLAQMLGLFAEAVAAPVLFVLGNHDAYRGTVAGAKRVAREAATRHRNLVFLDDGVIWPLSPDTAVVGHSSWYDGRLGDHGPRNRVSLSDFSMVGDLAPIAWSRQLLFERFGELGDEAAAAFAAVLPQALATHRRVIAVTHVPPFAEVSRWAGQPSAADYLPFFTCHAVGECLRGIMTARPDRELLVLSGHTHERAEATILPNLLARSATAVYGRPTFQMLSLD
jgi:hypothetical protein